MKTGAPTLVLITCLSLLCIVVVSGCSTESQLVEADPSLEMSESEMEDYNQAAFGGSER